MTTEELVIYLVSCAVNGEVPNKELLTEMDLEKVLELAKKHKIGCCTAMALESAGFKNLATTAAMSSAMKRNALFEASLQEVTRRLQEAGIAYVPLKGILLKKYYPLDFMREMADHDVLIEESRAEDVRKIMEDLGFKTKQFGVGFHDVYYKKPILNYEMHRALFANPNSRVGAYYQGMKDLSKPEDLYLYLIAHEHKHYVSGGTGLRSLLDVYLFLKKESLDWEYVDQEAEKIGIREFEEKNRLLAISLFGKGIVTDEKMLSYILSSNAYGILQHKVDNRIEKSRGNKSRYLLRRLSVPVRKSDPRYQVFALYYPLFYKYKILLPLLPFYRVFKAAASGKLTEEWKAIRRANDQD